MTQTYSPLFESLGIAKLIEGHEKRLALYLLDTPNRNADKLNRTRLYDLAICNKNDFFGFLMCETGRPNGILLLKLYHRYDTKIVNFEDQLKDILGKYKIANIFYETNVMSNDGIYDAIFRLGYSHLIPERKNISGNIKYATHYCIESILKSDSYPKEDDLRLMQPTLDKDDAVITTLILLTIGSLAEKEVNTSAQYMRELADRYNNDLEGIKEDILKQVKEKAQDGGTRLTVDCRNGSNVITITEYLESLGYKTEKPSPSAYLTVIW